MGPAFETKVATGCLTLLLCRGAPLCLGTGTLSSVHLQSGHLDWRTDDILLEATNSSGETTKAAIQVKLAFSLSENDPECVQTLNAALADFRNPALFDQRRDVIGLVTSSLSAKLTRGLRTLLDCARASVDAGDMARRLAIPGYLGKPALQYLKTIGAILAGAEGGAPSQDEIWQFLRCYQVVDLDLNVPEGFSETMLRSLLTASLPDGDRTAADASWNELMALALGGAGSATSYTRETLPPNLLQRHCKATGFSSGVSQLLQDTAVVDNGIHSAIAGKTVIPRRELFGDLCRLVETSPLVFVTGAAGSGKSAVVKSAFKIATQGGIGFGFRAVSLAGYHINEVLHRFGLSLDALQSQTAMHGKKVIWVDSLEQLMEKPPELRAAFLDLLRALKDDPTWSVIVTCRDYSAETVRTALFGEVGMVAQDIEIGELTDEEIDEVIVDFPLLERPLKDSSLRKLLRNPFFLDKAAKMNWDSVEPLPTTERAFLEKVWNEVIRRVDEDIESGLPRLRERVLIEVALRRAKALEPFVPSAELDSRALGRLVRDSILQTPSTGSDHYAPSHDVFEDWALMRWLDESFVRYEQELEPLLSDLGTHPALRRAYRRWLTAYLDADPKTTDSMVVELIQNQHVAAHWREDTLVGVLQSRDAFGFLDRNKTMLLADDAKLLRQVMHILRVACRAAIPLGKFGVNSTGDIFLPKGTGWVGIASLLEMATPQFTEADLSLIVGFLEDWILLTRYGLQYPTGAISIANVAWNSFPQTPWRSSINDGEERLLRVILAIPLAAQPILGAQIEEALREERPGHPHRDLLKLIFNHFACDAIFRDMPDLAFRVAEHALDLNRDIDEAVTDRSGYGSQEVSAAFGLGQRFELDDYPSSAFHGPYLRMLWHQTARGVDFILRFINRACDVYAHPDNRYEFVEPPGTVSLELPDGPHEQFGNWRLWAAYRGMHVAPNTFESALMALEYWLLDKVKREDPDLESTLLDLLRRSNNVAISAVVASVAAGAPTLAGEAAYVLLTSPAFLRADFDRAAQESFLRRQLGGFGMPLINAENGLYDKERRESAELEHRGRNLEHVAVMLQMTDRFRDRVWALIDRYKAELPPDTQQDKDTKVWRIRLHRIDTRNLKEIGRTEDGHVLFGTTEPEPDLQAMIEEQEPRGAATETAITLQNWGMSVFEGKATGDDWAERLGQAREFLESSARTGVELDFAKGGTAYVAAVCVRDHWWEMSGDEHEWCAQIICDAIETDADIADHFQIRARNPMEGSRPAAFVLPALFGKSLHPETQSRLLPTLAKAVMHAVEETSAYAMQGVGRFLWSSDRALALSCLQAVIVDAKERNAFAERQRGESFAEREPKEPFHRDLRSRLRESISHRKITNEAEIATFNLNSWPGREIAQHLFGIATQNPDDPLLRQLMQRCVDQLPVFWEAHARAYRLLGDADEVRYDPQIEHEFVDAICRYALKLEPTEALSFLEPIFMSAPRFPKGASSLVTWLALHQGDRTPSPTFWVLWQRFADSFAAGVDPGRTEDEHSNEAEMLRELFLGRNWAERRDWPPLHGETHRLRNLFSILPPMRRSFECYAYYLAKAGTPTLPDSLEEVAAKLQECATPHPLNETAISYLEEILTRLIYGGNSRIRSENILRRATLRILDELVAEGSSVAYKLRDDFLTPISL